MALLGVYEVYIVSWVVVRGVVLVRSLNLLVVSSTTLGVSSTTLGVGRENTMYARRAHFPNMQLYNKVLHKNRYTYNTCFTSHYF